MTSPQYIRQQLIVHICDVSMTHACDHLMIHLNDINMY